MMASAKFNPNQFGGGVRLSQGEVTVRTSQISGGQADKVKGVGIKRNNDSFVSKEGTPTVINKLAKRFNCNSILSRRSKEFKSLSPVNLDGKGIIEIESPEASQTNYFVQGEKKSIGNKVNNQALLFQQHSKLTTAHNRLRPGKIATANK